LLDEDMLCEVESQKRSFVCHQQQTFFFFVIKRFEFSQTNPKSKNKFCVSKKRQLLFLAHKQKQETAATNNNKQKQSPSVTFKQWFKKDYSDPHSNELSKSRLVLLLLSNVLFFLLPYLHHWIIFHIHLPFSFLATLSRLAR
jgi:hypothetical protein